MSRAGSSLSSLNRIHDVLSWLEPKSTLSLNWLMGHIKLLEYAKYNSLFYIVIISNSNTISAELDQYLACHDIEISANVHNSCTVAE